MTKAKKMHDKNSYGMSGIKNDMAEMAKVAKVLPKLPLLPVQIFINNRIGLQKSKIFCNFDHSPKGSPSKLFQGDAEH